MTFAALFVSEKYGEKKAIFLILFGDQRSPLEQYLIPHTQRKTARSAVFLFHNLILSASRQLLHIPRGRLSAVLR